MGLGAMAAEHVFYGENSAGVGGDVQGATARAALMVGAAGMGPARVDFKGRFEDPDEEELAQDLVRKRYERIGKRIMNRMSGGGPFASDPIAGVLGDPDKRAVAGQILGQAYMHAYSLMAANKPALEFVADRLIERREMHGDEVMDLLDEAGIVVPEVDLLDEATWPKI
jgi:hypothetical protein